MCVFQAEDGIRDYKVTGVQTCALPISNASFPSGVNFKRFAPRTFALIVRATLFSAIFTTAIVPACAFAAHSSLPSGETSNPSDPAPTVTKNWLHSAGNGPGAGPPAGGGGPDGKLGRTFSQMLTVPD